MITSIGELLIRDRIVSSAQVGAALDYQRVNGGRLGEALTVLGFIDNDSLNSFFQSTPPVPYKVSQTGLSMALLFDLMLRIAHTSAGVFTLIEMARRICLPQSVVDELVDKAKTEQILAVRSSTGSFNRGGLVFELTDKGRARTAMALESSLYDGPASVPLKSYQIIATHQTVRQIQIDKKWIRNALSDLVLDNRLLEQLGPAFNSGRSIFLYGPPGTGKSTIAESLGNALEGSIYVPYAIEVGGQILRHYDPAVHVDADDPVAQSAVALDVEVGLKHDPRWHKCRRPVVIVGGELLLENLDLDFDPISKFYETPVQMKAANGIFILDDFGRQQVPPRQLLNRWIVPLERGTDFLNLHTGKKFEILFDQISVFCTNLKPSELVDEAFLRRIRHKIRVPYQTETEFLETLSRVCEKQGISNDSEVGNYLIEAYYHKANRPLTGSHPRDLIEQIIDRARYLKIKPELSREALDAAASNYFVDL